MLSPTFALFAGTGQCAKLLIPFTFERVGDEAVTRIDQHEAALSELGFRLGAFDRATAQPVCFFMPGLDLLADFEREFDSRRRHLLSDQHADGFIDGRPGDRLTHRLPTINAGTITN
ncbi:hypothetical protein [Sinorhizobium medicae]